MELVPVPLVPTCAKKWVYKAVEQSVPREEENIRPKSSQSVFFGRPNLKKTELKKGVRASSLPSFATNFSGQIDRAAVDKAAEDNACHRPTCRARGGRIQHPPV